MEEVLNFCVEKIIMPACVLCILLLIVAVPFGIYAWYKADQAPTFALRKDRWQCTAAHTETSTTYIMVGKVLVPSTRTSSVCDQWSAR